MTAFWDTLLRRRLFRISAAYVVVAWVLVQVASVLFPAFDIPEWGLRFFVLLTILCLPVVLVLTWLLHGHGQTDDRMMKGRSWLVDGSLTAVIILMTGVAGVQMARLIPEIQAGTAGIRSGFPAIAVPAEANSIAVLPFAVFSASTEDDYFADGLTEEVLNSLARIDGLRVVGRTSSFYFKGRNLDVRDIASQLNVRFILEGSVRRAGERLRITAQLVEADSGFHLWSDTFDHATSDIIDVQEAIARQVASVLELAILSDGISPSTDPHDPEAQRLYLMGLARLRARTVEDIKAAIGLFEDAIEIDPDFGLAYAQLASSYLVFPDMALDGQDPGKLRDTSRTLLDKALTLAPDSSVALAVEGLWHLDAIMKTDRLDAETLATRDAAAAALERAIALDANNVEAHLWYGLLLMDFDRQPISALQQFRIVMSIDPLFLRGIQNAAHTLAAMGRIEEARRLFRQLVQAFPNNPDVYYQMSQFQAQTGRIDNAILWQEKAIARGQTAFGTLALASHLTNLAGYDEAVAALDGLTGSPLENVIPIYSALFSGDLDGAWAARQAISAIPEWQKQALPNWYFQLLLEDDAAALADLRAGNPELFTGGRPAVQTGVNAAEAFASAYLLSRRTDDAAARRSAARLFDALWDQFTPQRGYADTLCKKANRAAILAVRGRTAAALDAFDDAVGHGMAAFAMPLCGSLPWPLDEHPYFAPLAAEPRFAAALATLRARAAEQLDRVRTYRARTAAMRETP